MRDNGTAASGNSSQAAQAQGALRADLTVDDLHLLLFTFPTGQPPATRTRWLTLLLTGLAAR